MVLAVALSLLLLLLLSVATGDVFRPAVVIVVIFVGGSWSFPAVFLAEAAEDGREVVALAEDVW